MNIFNLFKYYAPEYEGKENLSFSTEESIYFQKPAKFNDPWDCKVPEITCPRGRKALNEILDKLEARGGQAFANERQKIKNLSRSEISQWLVGRFKKSYEELRSIMGVFSLSLIPDSELMWSHYATSHFGYMLHFQIDLDALKPDSSLKDLGFLIPVIYCNKREVWNLKDYDDNRLKYANDLIKYKSEAWEYECELRLLNVDEYGFIKTPSNWLKSIVIGINTEDELQGKLEDIGKSLNVPVLSAKMNEKEYKIDIPGLKINGDDGRRDYEKAKKMKTFNLH
jgi:hypothetical protein